MQATYRYDGMGNLILEAGPKGTGRSILFVGYAMTHPGAAMTDPFSPTLISTPRGEALRGRGVAEQKTALAALFGAVGEMLAGDELKGRLIVTLVTAGETGRHDAVDSVMKELEEAPNCAVVCIGTDNRIAVSNKGRIDFDIVIGGKAAHSSVPAQGINAITGAQRILKTLESIEIGVPEHPVFGQATLTPTAIESFPKATHTVPDKTRITFDRRLLPGEDPETAFKAITSKFSLEKPWSLAFERGPVMYPNELSLDGPFFAKLRAAFDAAGQGEPETFACNFALDAGYFSRRDIEAIMLGPGEVDHFHSSEEQVLVSDLVAMANVYYQLIRRCVGTDR
jgi:acetylornithine deacetylase/succinyl-diaminopimelate desuccinylase-like protein